MYYPEWLEWAKGVTIPRPCLDCGTPARATRCPSCERERNSRRNRARTGYHGDWAREARLTVAAWVSEHGYVCPGLSVDDLPEGKGQRYATPAHPATDLTCDHRPDGGRRVLCRPCNSRLGVLDPVHPHS
jgi:hypothetical protein